MGKNKKNNATSNSENGDLSFWVGILIMLVIFWPIGLIMLLKKLGAFSNPDKASDQRSRYDSESRSSEDKSRDNSYKEKIAQAVENAAREFESNTRSAAQGAQSKARDAAREAQSVAQEVAAELAQAARETGNAAKQVFSAMRSDKQDDGKRSGSSTSSSWKSATSKSQSWQSLANAGDKDGKGNAKGQSKDAAVSSTDSSAVSSPIEADSMKKTPGDAADSTGKSASAIPASDEKPQISQAEEKEASLVKASRSALDKKSGKLISVVMLLISIALFILGANSILSAARDIWRFGIDRWFDLGLGIFYFVGGFISFISRNTVSKRLARYKRYILLIAQNETVSINDLSKTLGLSTRTCKRDLQAMIDAGYLGAEAYIDHDSSVLILSIGHPQFTQDSRISADDNGSTGSESAILEYAPTDASEEISDNQYVAIIQELRELNGNIVDEDISEKIHRIEDASAMIFRIVEENPDKLPQIRRFLNYYLPTTIKLLRSYSTLEKQGINGENITAAKENISRVLEMLATGFEQQFDQLFKAEALDIAADITVLENLMQQDGLTESEPSLRKMEGV